MSAREHARALVAGGGIGGLAAALALAQKGRKVRVLEKAAEFGEIGYGIQMGPNVARMLDRLGVLEALEPASVFPEALIFADALTNEELSRISLGKAFLARYKFRYFVIHRRDLHGGLLEACRRREEIVLSPSHGLKAVQQAKRHHPRHCENGAEFEGAALIGADGLWSPTRQAVIGDGAPRMAGHYVYRGVVPIEDIADKSRMNTMTIWGGPDLHMVQYRLQGGAVMNNVATICSRRIRRGEPNPGAPDELEELFARTHPGRAREPALRLARAQLGAARPRSGDQLDATAASRCSATPRTRRCSTSLKEPRWRSRMRWCWPRKWPPQARTTTAPSSPTSASA